MKIKNAKLIIRINSFFSAFLAAFFIAGCASNLVGKYDSLTVIDGYKNIILMIGDGMGENHIKVAEAYNQAQSSITNKALVRGYVTTASSSSPITDSAAAATAMSTGEKVPNKAIAFKNGRKLTTMSEFAIAHEKGIGIIGTETVTGATMAAFSAHNPKRDNKDQIALEQYQSDIDVFIGAGKSYHDQKVESISQFKREYFSDFSSLENHISSIISGEKPVFSKVLAAFDSLSTLSSTPSSPTLSEAAILALEYLEQEYEEEGFFALIEGSHIDKRAHDGDIFGMIDQLNGFDKAVDDVVEWAREREDTFVMVTADHETGGLKYHGEEKNEISDEMFSISGHTAVDVPFYIYTIDNLSFITDGDVIDNTDIAKLLRAMMRAS
jgi:alkaline phosphatase